MVRVTTDCVYDEDKDDYVQKRSVLGYFAKREEALEALANYAKTPYSITETNVSVEKLWETVKETLNKSENRIKVYDSAFNMYMAGIKDMKIRDVKAKHLLQIMDDCPYGSSTKANIHCVMKHIFTYAVQNDLVDKNYSDFITVKQDATKLERTLYTDEEVMALWDKADQEEYALTLVLLHQGMRIKEFRDHPKIDLDAKTITIEDAKNEYSKRTIPINMAVYDLLVRFVEHPTTISKTKYERFTTKELGHRAYDVRHTFASKCNKLKIDKLIIQRIMGHKPETILHQTYTHLTIEELSEGINMVKYGDQ